jgi:hypothetical protein
LVIVPYPALWSPQDQDDAYSIAARLCRADQDGRLAAFFKPT